MQTRRKSVSNTYKNSNLIIKRGMEGDKVKQKTNRNKKKRVMRVYKKRHLETTYEIQIFDMLVDCAMVVPG
jgi:hypothetical protein